MKKIILLFCIFLLSCSLSEENKTIQNNTETKNISRNTVLKDIKKIPEKEEIKKNELTVHFDYPVLENSEIDKVIKIWGKNLIKITKKEYKKDGSIEKPELYFSFEIFENKFITSIIYRVEKRIYKNHSENFSKVFYVGKNGKILEFEDFLLTKKDKILDKILDKIKEKNINIFKENLEKDLGRYLENPKVYFEKQKVFFVFDEYEIAPHSEGTIKIDFYLKEFRDFLNPEIFKDLKKQEVLTKLKEVKEKQKLLEENFKPLVEEEKNDKVISNTNSGTKEISKKLETKTSSGKQILEEKKAEKIDSSKKYVALTFDDGPSKTLTPKLLDILKKYNINATFCVVGKNVNYFPEIVEREFYEGNEICNHSWAHPNLTKLKKTELQKEINNTDSKIIEITGEKPKVFRPPYGAYNDEVKTEIGRTILMWDVDSKDRKNRNIEKNIKAVEKDLKDGSIILFHDIHKESVETIEPLLKKLKAENYEFVTVSKLLEMGQKGDYSKKVCFGKYDCR